MDDSLTIDEYDALEQISAGKKTAKPSACVARNTKRLSGLKYIAIRKDGSLQLTEKGTQTLFVKHCIEGLRAVALDSQVRLEAGVATFLCKKGHIEAQAASDGFILTQRGRETLADIDAQASH